MREVTEKEKARLAESLGGGMVNMLISDAFQWLKDNGFKIVKEEE